MIGKLGDRWNLFLCSFTILFVELACIRWIPAYIRYLGYFTNFVLLGSFLGIGLGILQARRRFDLQTFFPRRSGRAGRRRRAPSSCSSSSTRRRRSSSGSWP